MARPARCRRIEQMPAFRSFSPDDAPAAWNMILTRAATIMIAIMEKAMTAEAMGAGNIHAIKHKPAEEDAG